MRLTRRCKRKATLLLIKLAKCKFTLAVRNVTQLQDCQAEKWAFCGLIVPKIGQIAMKLAPSGIFYATFLPDGLMIQLQNDRTLEIQFFVFGIYIEFI